MYKTNREFFTFFFQKCKKKENLDIKYLQRNNLYDYYSVLTNKYKYFNKTLHEVKCIVEIFNEIEKQTGIPYFTMKSFLNYPFIDDDIDFIICNNGYRIYINELKKRGFSHRKDIADLREPMKKMFKHPAYSIIPHVHSEISWNGIITCDKAKIFERTIYHNIDNIQVRIPCATDELLIAIGHLLFENYYFKIGEFIYLQYLLTHDIDYTRIETIAKQYGYKKGLGLYFSYTKAIAECYNVELNIPAKYTVKVSVSANKMFPYYIPYSKLIPTYIENFGNGIKKIQILNLFRKLFTYTLVGYIWKYLLQIKRQKKFISRFQD